MSEFGVISGVMHLNVAQDLQAGSVGVVHEEEAGAVVSTDVANGEQLAVAFEIGKGEVPG